VNSNAKIADYCRVIFSVVALVALFNSGRVFAGKSNLDTGEQCWGAGCIETDKDLPTNSGSSSGSNSAGGFLPGNITTPDCSDSDRDKIAAAVTWLEHNVALIDAKMEESDHLMFWPRNSRENFREKFDQTLKIVCINQKNKCDPDPLGRRLGISYPGVAQSRINLCTDNIRAVATDDGVPNEAIFARTIAHEVGHLIRINAHRSDCVRTFEEPRFSRSLGFAAQYAYLGVPYDPKEYTSRCPEPTAVAPFDWTRKSENMEVPLEAQK